LWQRLQNGRGAVIIAEPALRGERQNQWLAIAVTDSVQAAFDAADAAGNSFF
jgi:hypothetical protein